MSNTALFAQSVSRIHRTDFFIYENKTVIKCLLHLAINVQRVQKRVTFADNDQFTRQAILYFAFLSTNQ